MGEGFASDEVIDLIAEIEMQRQRVESEAGLSSACAGALRRLHELLDRETKALQLHDPGTGHTANVDAVKLEIERVKKLSGVANQRPGKGAGRPNKQGPGQPPRKNEPRAPSRDRGRRTMGRGGGR